MIISAVGSKSWKIRFAYGIVFALLILGAVTMVYPFLLMLSGSVHSEADSQEIAPVPGFWHDDVVLLRKYAESKHNASLEDVRLAWNLPATSWQKLDVQSLRETAASPEAMAAFREWRASPEAAPYAVLGNASGARLLPSNAREWRRVMERRFRGDLGAFTRTMGIPATDWSGVALPAEFIARYRYPFVSAEARGLFSEFKSSRNPADFYFPAPEADFLQYHLSVKYGSALPEINRALGTKFTEASQLSLDPDPALSSPAYDAEVEIYLRNSARLFHLRIDVTPELSEAYRDTLRSRHSVIRSYNAMHGTSYADFGEIALPGRLDEDPSQLVEWGEFVRDTDACPRAAVHPDGPAQSFARFLASRGAGTTAPDFCRLAAAVDMDDALLNARALRREFTRRNYLQVLDYIALHGNGIVNTLVYCALAILTAVLVNPLAAYALSRFHLPGTYQILLFCMATMAFPGEVSMIPSFILLKRFPLWPLAAGCVAMFLAHGLLSRSNVRMRARLPLAAFAGLLVGGVLLPLVLGPDRSTVSLLNTFAALILPGAANGYFIFLLKGFFDSMPKELYEAAELDGAGEWTKFWTLTIRLSKPILAVIALNAFTAAYSAFMMALIIIPDPEMWTLMVWIFQLQSQANGAVVYASIVLAAVPTFLVFAFCQNLIIRGIVVPMEK